MKDYYNILGVTPDASTEQIKEAYRKLAKEHHPDRNGQLHKDIFKDINEAKQVLLSQEKKAEYDMLLTDFSLYTNFYSKKQKNSEIFYLFISKPVVKLVFASFVIGIVMVLFATQEGNQDKMIAAGENQETETKNIAVKPYLETGSSSKKETFENVKNNITSDPATEKYAKNGKKQQPEKINKAFRKEKLVLLDKDKMASILLRIHVQAIRSGKNINCVRLRKAINSNVANAMEMAQYLKSNGFVIAGREVVKEQHKGININTKGNLLYLTIGYI